MSSPLVARPPGVGPSLRGLLVVLLAVGASGCFPARYVAQAARGQLNLVFSSRPIDLVVRDPKTPARVSGLLAFVPAIKAFGEEHGLTATQSYSRFVQVKGRTAVWVVQACAPDAFAPRRWAFPIVGSVPYLGFFDEGAARAFAAELAQGGALDVDVRGASTYSTLGWFKDPVLSSMLAEGDGAVGELANAVLHESTHATVYLQGQSAFDESLGSFVADRLTEAWLAARFGASSREARGWAQLKERSARRVERMHRAYQALDELYRSGRPRAEVLARKAELLASLAAELSTRRDFNNASLMGFRLYDTGREGFEHLLEVGGGDFRAFFRALRSLSERDFPRTQTEDFSATVEALARRTQR